MADAAAPEPSHEEVVRALRDYVWSRERRERLQSDGLNVLPVSFYSNVPSIEEIESSFEYAEGEPPYLDTRVFDAERMRATLKSLIPHASGFTPDLQGDEASCANGFFWENSQFSASDAMAYFAFLRMLGPGRVVEIGSGFSTLVAAEALKANGRGQITCIEPYPRPFLAAMDGIDLRKVRAQDLTARELDDLLEDGDVLFIDSTHTVKTGSDCLHIYLRLLPYLTKRVYVHIHDIALPFGMPKEWQLDMHIYWTEQYVVMAMLQDNPRAKVLFGSNYHLHFNPDLLGELMYGRYRAGGGSLWLEYAPR